MQAITRGWVVQVTPVHERSSPRAARFCFEFYTVTHRAGGALLMNTLALPAPSCGAAPLLRRQLGKPDASFSFAS